MSFVAGNNKLSVLEIVEGINRRISENQSGGYVKIEDQKAKHLTNNEITNSGDKKPIEPEKITKVESFDMVENQKLRKGIRKLSQLTSTVVNDPKSKLALRTTEDGKQEIISKARGVNSDRSGHSKNTVDLMTSIFPKVVSKVTETGDVELIDEYRQLLESLASSQWGLKIAKNNPDIDTAMKRMLKSLEKCPDEEAPLKDTSLNKDLKKPLTRYKPSSIKELKENYKKTKTEGLISAKRKVSLEKKIENLKVVTKTMKKEGAEDKKIVIVEEGFKAIARRKSLDFRTATSIASKEAIQEAINVLRDGLKHNLIDSTDLFNIRNRLQNDIEHSKRVLEKNPDLQKQLDELYTIIKIEEIQPVTTTINHLIATMTSPLISSSIQSLLTVVGNSDVLVNGEGVRVTNIQVENGLKEFKEFLFIYSGFKEGITTEPPSSLPSESIRNFNIYVETLITQAAEKMDPNYKKSGSEAAKIRAEVKASFSNSGGSKPIPIDWVRMQELIVTLGYFAKEHLNSSK